MNLNKKQRKELCEKYGGKCAYCGIELPEKWHADHLKPVVKENFTPEPIKFEDPVPEYVYTVTQHGIFRFAVSRYHSEKSKATDGTITNKEKVFAFEGDKCLDGTKTEVTLDIGDCYRTLEDAVLVAKQKWEVEQ